MQCVFEGNNSIETKLIEDMLENQGISTLTRGESLEIATGELPAQGLIKILVEDEDKFKAREIISEFYRLRNEDADRNSKESNGLPWIDGIMRSLRQFLLGLTGSNKS